MTKAELRTFVKQLTGNQTDAALTDAWYDDRVMDGYRRLVTFQGLVTGPAFRQPQMRILKFPTLEDRLTRTLDTALTSNFVANQSNVLLVLAVYDRTNNRALDWASEDEQRTRDADENEVPRQFRVGAAGGVTGYYIWPFPGVAAHNIDVYEFVTLDVALATDSTEPNIPLEWHPAIAYAAAAETTRLLDMPERMVEMEGSFKNEIAERVSPGERAALGGKGGLRRNIRVGSW